MQHLNYSTTKLLEEKMEKKNLWCLDKDTNSIMLSMEAQTVC
jgi:hypothetical protein